jgi:hypothetical protein
MEIAKPKVLIWFRVYLALLCLTYVLVMLFGFLDAFFPALRVESPDEKDVIAGWICMIGGAVFLTVSIVPFLIKPRPWVWFYDLLVICMGMVSCCLIPLSIPLLIFWTKPETKSYFRKTNG